MVIKKVTVKFDSCADCPIQQFIGCSVYLETEEVGALVGEFPVKCPIETTAMLNRYTEFSSSRSSSGESAAPLEMYQAGRKIDQHFEGDKNGN